MCAACVEYIKDKLTEAEFKSALKEITREDKAHATEVEQLVQKHAGKPEELKKQLRDLS